MFCLSDEVQEILEFGGEEVAAAFWIAIMKNSTDCLMEVVDFPHVYVVNDFYDGKSLVLTTMAVKQTDDEPLHLADTFIGICTPEKISENLFE